MERQTQQIIEACKRGSRKGQLTLYQLHARRLYNACLRILGNREEAEEAMQDSFLKIFTRLHQYQPGQSFEAWMQRVAIHTAIDTLRRRDKEMEELSQHLAEPEPEEDNEEMINHSVARVKEAIAKLSSGYRVVLSLYLFEGYDMEEIATILQVKPASVRSQYLRAKRKVHEILDKKE
ncbi:RNA polymerase sigma factor [Parabacteroides sp. OttesenSCG-928-N08]|nr:RNA polymerase sigma factor [Parabacteroides sp. OttesenSCG-928-N08]